MIPSWDLIFIQRWVFWSEESQIWRNFCILSTFKGPFLKTKNGELSLVKVTSVIYAIYYENMTSAFPNCTIRLQLSIHFFNFENIQKNKFFRKLCNLWMEIGIWFDIIKLSFGCWKHEFFISYPYWWKNKIYLCLPTKICIVFRKKTSYFSWQKWSSYKCY